MKRAILIGLFAQFLLAQQITTNNVQSIAKQGNGTKFQLAGTVSGTGATICTDANGNTTTSGCTAYALSLFSAASPISYNSSTGQFSCPTCVVTTGSYANPAWITAIGWSTLTGLPSLVNTITAGTHITNSGTASNPIINSTPYAWSEITGTKQGNTNVPQMAGTNSGTSGAALCNDASGNATTSGCNITPAGTAPFQEFSSDIATNNYLGKFRTASSVYVPNYNFSAITPGGSLTAGTQPTITLAPCPYGLVGGGTYASKLYISGGTGTAEPVLISVLTGTPGAASCTVTVTSVTGGNIAYNHTGAWTVTSATSGWQEALNATAATGARLYSSLPISTIMHAGIIVPHNNYILDGQGTTMVRQEDYANGDLIQVNDTGACCYEHRITQFYFNNVTVAAQTTGAVIHIIFAHADIDNVYNLTGGPHTVIFDSAGDSRLSHFRFISEDSHSIDSILLTAAAAGQSCTDINIEFGEIFTFYTGITIAGADGVKISHLEGAGHMITMLPGGTTAAGYYIANIMIEDPLFDSPPAGGINISITGLSGSSVGGISIRGGSILGSPGAVSGHGVYGITVGPGTGTAPQNIIISGVQFSYFDQNAIAMNGNNTVPNVISGNTFGYCNLSNTVNVPCITLNGTSATITGNTFNAPNATWCIGALANVPKLTLTGNDMSGCLAPLTLDTGYGTPPVACAIRNNQGVNNVTRTVADAATVVWPFGDNITITGSGTAITAVTLTNVCGNATGTVIATGGNLTVTAGATIGASGTLTQNKMYTWKSDGTKIWFSY